MHPSRLALRRAGHARVPAQRTDTGTQMDGGRDQSVHHANRGPVSGGPYRQTALLRGSDYQRTPDDSRSGKDAAVRSELAGRVNSWRALTRTLPVARVLCLFQREGFAAAAGSRLVGVIEDEARGK